MYNSCGKFSHSAAVLEATSSTRHRCFGRTFVFAYSKSSPGSSPGVCVGSTGIPPPLEAVRISATVKKMISNWGCSNFFIFSPLNNSAFGLNEIWKAFCIRPSTIKKCTFLMMWVSSFILHYYRLYFKCCIKF